MSEPIRKQQGQGMVEYLIVVMLISLGAIIAFSVFGQSIRSQTAQVSVQVSGGQDQGVRVNVVGVGGGGKHCCGVRGNPPSPPDDISSHHS